MNRIPLISLLFLLIMAANVSADQVTETDKLVKSLNNHVQNNKSAVRIIANVADDGKPDDWREFENDEKRAESDSGYNLNDNFFILKTEIGTYLYALFQSPSRDWAQYVTYFFRADGSLTKMETQLRTFIGQVIAIRNRWFSTDGTQLKIEREFLDLTTEEPTETNDEFYDIKEPVYIRISQVPIYEMIRE